MPYLKGLKELSVLNEESNLQRKKCDSEQETWKQFFIDHIF